MTTSAQRRTTRPAYTLRSRLRLVFAGAALLVAFGGSAAVVSLVQLDHDADRLTDRISPSRIASAALATATVDQESGLRGFILTAQPEFLEPYSAGRSKEFENAQVVRDRLGDEPAVISALDSAARAMQVWRTQYAEPSIVAINESGLGTEVDEATGKRLFDDVRLGVQALSDALDTERVAARDELGDTQRRLHALVAIALIAGIAAALAIAAALRSTVTRPLERLQAETRLVAAGDFRRRVTAFGPAEITALGADVDDMRARIVALLGESEEREAELRVQSAELRAQGEELRAQGEELRVQGAELRTQTEELASREADLLRSNDELEQFAYVASHDLQEPLRKVASFCQMLQRRYSGQLDEQADQYIAFAVDGAKRMQVLINDLLTFSRVGRSSESMTEIDTAELAARAVDTFAETRAEAGAEIDVGTLPVVRGEHSLLTQLFYNVVGNALKFRSPDRAVRVRLDAEREGEHWHFRCVDNGIGIEAEYAERVFVIFQRLHTKDQYGGTGIGLALCKKIVEYHGGTIWIDPERTDGTTVHWTLPAPVTPDPKDVPT